LLIRHLSSEKGKISLSLFSIAMILVLSSCGIFGNSSGNTTSTTSTGPISIGISLSLTGDASGDGQSLKQGYQLWQDYINQKGGLLGHHVNLVIKDDATRPEQARVNYQDLIASQKVNFVFGPFDDAFTVNGATVAAKYGYTFLQGTGTSPQDFQHGLTNMFCVSLSASKYMSSLVKYMLSLPPNIRPKSVAYATADDPFTFSQVDPSRTLLEAGGIKTAFYDKYPLENTDLNAVAQKIINTHPDAVILGTDSISDSVKYVNYFKSQHFNPKILLATSGPDQGSAFTGAIGGSKNAEGILIANGGWWPDIKTYQNDYFVPAFLKKYGGAKSDIGSDAVQAFSIGQVLEQAANKTHSLDNGKLMQYMHSDVNFQTLQGTVHFAADGQNTLAVPYLFQWQKDNLIPIYPLDQAQAQPEYPKHNWGT
jgi:branched-chain amino acid transport system substrate-binding protein